MDQNDVKELKFDVPWGHIAAKAWGNPKKKRVLAVHGTLDNAGSFTNLFKLLPNKYYIIGIDLPGHGLSSHYTRGVNLGFFNYVLVIKYVLDQLQWNTCLYLGHSLGGQLGIMFAALFPGRLEKVISVDAFLPTIIRKDEILYRMRELSELSADYVNEEKSARFYTKEEVLDALRTRRQFALNDTAAKALFDRAVTKVGDNSYKYNRDTRMRLFLIPPLNHTQYTEIIKDIKTPILLILSTNSWFTATERTRDDFKFYKSIKPNNCTIEIVEGNHDVHNNEPEKIVSIIDKYLDNDNINISTKSKL